LEHLERLVETLYAKDTKTAYEAFLILKNESETSDAVYSFFDRFAEMMEAPNSYLRTRGLLLLCANARWDNARKLDALSDLFLTHITDPKPITARQFIQALPQVAAAKPKLAPKIREALENADLSGYSDSMAPLILKDIIAALKHI